MSSFNPDWGCSNNSAFACWNHQLVGPTALIDRDRAFGRVGIEAEGRWIHYHTYGLKQKLIETNYLFGPRVEVHRSGRCLFLVKGLIGESSITVPAGVGTGHYFTYAIGPTLEYSISSSLRLRGEYEYQRWPSFTGDLGQNGLTPNGLSFGARYRIPRLFRAPTY